MIAPEDIRDSAALLDILDWVRVMRGQPDNSFVLDLRVNLAGPKREIVMPPWLFKLMLNDLEIYATSTLASRGVDLAIMPASQSGPGA